MKQIFRAFAFSGVFAAISAPAYSVTLTPAEVREASGQARNFDVNYGTVLFDSIGQIKYERELNTSSFEVPQVEQGARARIAENAVSLPEERIVEVAPAVHDAEVAGQEPTLFIVVKETRLLGLRATDSSFAKIPLSRLRECEGTCSFTTQKFRDNAEEITFRYRIEE